MFLIEGCSLAFPQGKVAAAKPLTDEGNCGHGKRLYQNDKFPSSVCFADSFPQGKPNFLLPKRAYEQYLAAAALRETRVDRRERWSLGAASFIFNGRFSLAFTAASRKLAGGKFLA